MRGFELFSHRHRALALAAAALLACSEDTPQGAPAEPEAGIESETALDQAPNARPETEAMLLEDLAATRHPSDGGGAARIESLTPVGEDGPIRAGGRARIEIVFEAGPLGIAEQGSLFLQTSPFWDWGTPQAVEPDAPGYTEVSTSAEGVSLAPRTLDRNLMEIRVEGRSLRAGERIVLVLGAGPLGVGVDRYAERGASIWFAVDGDGDGIRQLLADSPRVDVAPREAVQLQATLPSTARPGEPVVLNLAWLDGRANAVTEFTGEVELLGDAALLALPDRVSFAPEHRGTRRLEGVAAGEGVVRVIARAAEMELDVESNPLVVSASAPRVLWADLHGHSNLSDGTGTPDDYFRYARDFAALDVAALTDHDHWGMRFLDQHPSMWESITAAVRRHHAPSRFVSLLGYEWTSWIHGHRHVLYFADQGAVYSSIAPETDSPPELWRALEGQAALTFAHHSAGGPVGTNWRHVPPPSVEPVTEITSVHGSSEAADSPGPIYDPVAGNFVRDVLDAGLRFGFVGSGDSHDGHPGLAHLQMRQGGLAAIFAEQATRADVLDALRKRRCYATNGPRIWMRFALDGQPMGSTVRADAERPTHEIEIAAVSPGPLERIEIVRSGVLLPALEGGGKRSFSTRVGIPRLERGEYVYARIVQEDGGAAWSSPIFVD